MNTPSRKPPFLVVFFSKEQTPNTIFGKVENFLQKTRIKNKQTPASKHYWAYLVSKTFIFDNPMTINFQKSYVIKKNEFPDYDACFYHSRIFCIIY